MCKSGILAVSNEKDYFTHMKNLQPQLKVRTEQLLGKSDNQEPSRYVIETHQQGTDTYKSVVNDALEEIMELILQSFNDEATHNNYLVTLSEATGYTISPEYGEMVPFLTLKAVLPISLPLTTEGPADIKTGTIITPNELTDLELMLLSNTLAVVDRTAYTN